MSFHCFPLGSFDLVVLLLPLYLAVVEQEGFSGGSVGKNPHADAGDTGLIPRSGRSPGEGNSHPLWYSCLKNHLDRGTCQASVRGAAKSQTQASDQKTHAHRKQNRIAVGGKPGRVLYMRK